MNEIIPGILEKEWGAIEQKIELVRPFARTIHIDLLDGKFAENETFRDPEPFKKYTGDLFFELHMMVDDPAQYVEPFAKAGFRRFLGHLEKMPDAESFIAKAQQLGEVGLAIDGPTALDKLPVPLLDLDCLLIMTIKAGFSGQDYVPSYAEKIQQLREKDALLPVAVDGGMNKETIKAARELGANRFVVTSALFKENPAEEFVQLHKCLE